MKLIDSLPLAIYSADTTLCLPACITPLVNTFSADSLLAFAWTPAAGVANPLSKNTTICPPASDTAITYTLHAWVPGAACDTFTPSFTILQVSRPAVSATVPSGPATTCLEAPLPISVTAAPAYQSYEYRWQPAAFLDNDTSANPLFTNNSTPGSYDLLVTATPLVNGSPMPGCAGTETLTITVLPIALALLTPDTAICYGQYVQVAATGSEELSYQWQPVTDPALSDATILNPVITPDTTGAVTYTLTASYPNCPDMVKSFTLQTDPFPITVRLSSDTTVCVEDRLLLCAGVSPASDRYQFHWSAPDGGSFLPAAGRDSAMVFDVAATTDVIAMAATPAGCSGSDTMRITAEPCCHLNVATAFTPNGDGRNDVLRVVGERGAKVSHFRIYNRWGQMVYRQTGRDGGWDGAFQGVAQEVGTYFYEIKYRCPGSKEDKIMKGDVTLLR